MAAVGSQAVALVVQAAPGRQEEMPAAYCFRQQQEL
jgi:hypothetical protein